MPTWVAEGQPNGSVRKEVPMLLQDIYDGISCGLKPQYKILLAMPTAVMVFLLIIPFVIIAEVIGLIIEFFSKISVIKVICNKIKSTITSIFYE